jgi:hypothetical protein
MVDAYRRFGVTYYSHLQRRKVQARYIHDSIAACLGLPPTRRQTSTRLHSVTSCKLLLLIVMAMIVANLLKLAGTKQSLGKLIFWWHEVATLELTLRTLKNAVFWDVMPCGSCESQFFGGTCRLHHQGEKIPEYGILHSHHRANITSYVSHVGYYCNYEVSAVLIT